jgi:hypothetical protein
MKKKLILFFILSLVGFVAGFILTNSLDMNICSQDEYRCRELMNNIGDPLIYSMPALALVFLILFFTPNALPAWKKFAKWFIPIAGLFFIFYSEPASGDLLSPYPEEVFRFLSILYVVISIAIILFQQYKQRKIS